MYNYIINGHQVFKSQPSYVYIGDGIMTKRKRTGLSGSEWKRIFAEVARKCAVEAKRSGIRYQDCIRQELAKYR